MRTREGIWNKHKENKGKENSTHKLATRCLELILEVLLDIRDSSPIKKKLK